MSIKHKAHNANSAGGVVIGRQLGEAVVIGDDIRITYIGRQGGRVRLLIKAPRELTITRENKEDTEITYGK